MKFSFVLALLLSLASGASSSETHGSELFEWGGMFEGSADNYIWVAQKVDGEYADPTLKMVVVVTDSSSEEAFDAAEEKAEILFETGECTSVVAGGIITPSNSACIQLTFDTNTYESKFIISAIGPNSGLAIFTEHYPTEFEATSHYLRDINGVDIEPVHTTDEADDMEGASLSTVLFGCFVVNLATFSGVIFIALSTNGISKLVQGVLNGFASGALIACAVYLMVIESVHLVSDFEWTTNSTEVDYTWRWGTALLAGFLAPYASHLVLRSLGMDIAHLVRGDSKDNMELSKVQNDAQVKKQPKDEASSMHTDNSTTLVTAENGHSASAILVALCLGDFMHNFTDGVFIGAAFKLCSPDVAWGIIWGTCAHEVAQEIADYVMFTSEPVNLSPARALAINFVVGLSCVLGGLVINQTEINNGTLGLLLAFGSGTYLQLGASVSLPAAIDSNSDAHHITAVVVAFILACVAIGLILLDHGHCEAEGAGHAHR